MITISDVACLLIHHVDHSLVCTEEVIKLSRNMKLRKLVLLKDQMVPKVILNVLSELKGINQI